MPQVCGTKPAIANIIFYCIDDKTGNMFFFFYCLERMFVSIIILNKVLKFYKDHKETENVQNFKKIFHCNIEFEIFY